MFGINPMSRGLHRCTNHSSTNTTSTDPEALLRDRQTADIARWDSSGSSSGPRIGNGIGIIDHSVDADRAHHEGAVQYGDDVPSGPAVQRRRVSL